MCRIQPRWHRAAASQGLFRPINETYERLLDCRMPMNGHFHTHYKTLKNREVTEISSCFAISVETALIVGLEIHQGMHP